MGPVTEVLVCVNVVSPSAKFGSSARSILYWVSLIDTSVHVSVTDKSGPGHGQIRHRDRRDRKHQRVHEVHLFVREDVAVPHVLPAEVDVVVRDPGELCSVRSEPPRRCRRRQRGAFREPRIDQPDAVWQLERQLGRGWNGRPQRDEGHLQRVDPDGLLPPRFDRIHRLSDHLTALVHAVDQLRREQMRVDRVRIHAVVEDPPDLRPVRQRSRRESIRSIP